MTTPAPSIKAFLDCIAWSEGTSRSPITQNNGYDVVVTGVDGPSIFTDYSDHPFAKGLLPVCVRENPPLYSTAAGRYQLLLRYWAAYRAELHLPDFSPTSQDVVAIQQMKERGAVAHIAAGDIQGAINACSNIWASFPNNAGITYLTPRRDKQEEEMDKVIQDRAAYAAHEANRVLCLALGDNSQPKWADAPDWQRISAVKGVEMIVANPATTPEQSHEGWLSEKSATGWKYGPVKNPETKEHPCFVPYGQLPENQRLKDEMFGLVVRAVLWL